MSLSSNSAKQSTSGNRLVSLVVPVIAALVITALVAPLAANWLDLPLPPWMAPWQAFVGQTLGIEEINPLPDIAAEGDVVEGTQTEEAWPTPPDGLLAASGLITSTVEGVLAAPTETPTPRPTRTTIILPTPSWKEMNYLSSVKFSASTLVEIERSATIALFGDITTDRLLVKAVGDVLVGVDLGKVSNVEIEGRAIRLSLPHPEVMSVELLPNETQVYESERTLFLSQYDGLETEALEQARQQLRIEIRENDGLMKIAQEMSRLQLIEFLESVGYREIEIEFPYLDTSQEQN